MVMFLEAAFWSGVIVILYSYIGYPALLLLLNRLIPADKPLAENSRLPKVSLVIAAYNEEKVIDDKIRNSLEIDYPEGLFEVWVASDGSDDGTNGIVRKWAGKDGRVRLLELPRSGKSEAINRAMERISGEIAVFSDANTVYSPDSIKRLVRRFNDPRAGCVCGRLVYRNTGRAASGRGEGLYWRYETFLKVLESRLGFIAGANGAIYAIRKGLFEPLARGTINDDLVISMRIVRKGCRSVYEDKAVAYEDVAPTVGSEFRRHVRDGAGHYLAAVHLIGLLNPFLGTRSLIYLSHRVLRWGAPFLMIAMLFANIALKGEPFYALLLIPHIGFYLLAFAGFFVIKTLPWPLPFFVYGPFYFCNLNLALFFGFLKALTGSQGAAWERTERA
ncbi:MAG: glycosyltransferase family 2 protein [Deltaproteobacteria bacterium]|nr:glycosyltransferase family 2 protein [Deltaproteobacteria bacterium]